MTKHHLTTIMVGLTAIAINQNTLAFTDHTTHWTLTSSIPGDWGNEENWDNGLPGSSGDTLSRPRAVVNNGGTAIYSDLTSNFDGLIVENASRVEFHSGIAHIIDAFLSVTDSSTLLKESASLTTPSASVTNGLLQIEDDATLTIKSFELALKLDGHVIQNGGSIITPEISFFEPSTFEYFGGTLNANAILMRESTSRFIQHHGIVNIGGIEEIGVNPNIPGGYELRGGRLKAGGLTIERLNVSDGTTLEVDSELRLIGNLNLTGSSTFIMRGRVIIESQDNDLTGLQLNLEGDQAIIQNIFSNSPLGTLVIGAEGPAIASIEAIEPGFASFETRHLQITDGSSFNLGGEVILVSETVTIGSEIFSSSTHWGEEFLPEDFPQLFDSVGGGKIILVPEANTGLSCFFLATLLYNHRSGKHTTNDERYIGNTQTKLL